MKKFLALLALIWLNISCDKASLEPSSLPEDPCYAATVAKALAIYELKCANAGFSWESCPYTVEMQSRLLEDLDKCTR